MQYAEFLRLTGASECECEIGAYQAYVEPAYMGNDDLFPTKDALVSYWHKFGLLGFTPDRIKALRSIINSIRQSFCWRSGEPSIKDTKALMNVIGNAAFGTH